MSISFKSTSEVNAFIREKATDDQKDLLMGIAVNQLLIRNNMDDNGWVLMRDLGGSRKCSPKKELEALVSLGLLERKFSQPVRYRIPDFTSSTK